MSEANEIGSYTWESDEGWSPLMSLNIKDVGRAILQRREEDPETATIIDLSPFQQHGQEPEAAWRNLTHQTLTVCRDDSHFEHLELVACSPQEAEMFTDCNAPGSIRFEYCEEDPRRPLEIPDLTLEKLMADFNGVVGGLAPDVNDHPQTSVVIRINLGQL